MKRRNCNGGRVALVCFGVLILAAASTQATAAKKKEEPPQSIRADASAGVRTQWELQLELMSFADSFLQRIVEGVALLTRNDLTTQERLTAARTRLVYVTGAVTIASGPDARIGLLDMAAMTRLGRMIQEDYWAPQWGARGEPLLNAFQKSEQDMWKILRRTLSPEQLRELEQLIAGWRADNPDAVSAGLMRFSEFGGRGQSLIVELGKGLFSSVGQATEQLDQIRLLGERALYYAQRAPFLVEWQSEVALLKAARTRETTTLLNDIDRLTATVESIGNTFQKFPAVIATERSRTINQFLEGFATERQATIEQAFGEIEEERRQLIEQALSAVGDERQAAIDQVFGSVGPEREALVDDLAAAALKLGILFIAVFLVGLFFLRLIYALLAEKVFHLSSRK